MTLITELVKAAKNGRVHEAVEADFSVFCQSNKKYLQINTYSSKTREFKGKVSQSIQLDEKAMNELLEIIKKELN